MTEPNATETLDACGLACPLPLLKAKQALNKLNSGDILKIVCTDAGSVRDFDVFAKQSGNGLLASEQAGETYSYWLQKA